MVFRNFLYSETDKDPTFLPKDPSPEFGTISPSMSINTELPLVDAEQASEAKTVQIIENVGDLGGSPMHQKKLVIHPGSVAERIKDRKFKTRGGSSKLPDDSPFLTIFYDDEGLTDVLELQDANAFLDNAVNRRARELLNVVEQIKGECDVLKAREKLRDKECEELKTKCEAAMTDFNNNSIVKLSGEPFDFEPKVASLEAEKARLEAIKASIRQEVEDFIRYGAEVVSKVVPYIAMEIVHNDELGTLVGKLVSSEVFYGRCASFEEAGNDLATATFLFLSEVVADPSASVKALFSKKPPTLRRPTPTRTYALAPSFQKATPSSALVSKPQSSPAV
nr:hypothetical protein [Tanacetum cinerariifolium]